MLRIAILGVGLVCLSVVQTLSANRANTVIDFELFLPIFSERYPERSPYASQWQQTIGQLKGLEESQWLKPVNDFVHQSLSYRTDMNLYGQNDYWASPMETLGQGLGDCEDWAIMAYTTLRHLGVEDSRLRLIYVKAKIGGASSSVSQAHMVVGYYETLSSDPMILDSLVKEVMPASSRTDLIPVFSFNGAGIWAGQLSDRPLANSTSRLSRWRNLIDRMVSEGMNLEHNQ